MRFILFLSALSVAGHAAVGQIELVNRFPNLTFERITDIQPFPDGSNRMLAVDQAGIIQVFDNHPLATSAGTFLDIRSSVHCCGEAGLLSVAFHPEFGSNGYFFVYYLTATTGLRSRVSRFAVSPPDAGGADPDTEVIILEIDQPHFNHNGGQLRFGLDGYLYVGVGDGGGGSDPGENAENITNLLGSILRLDVDNRLGSLEPDCGAGSHANYRVPLDNPFAHSGGCAEIYAYGLRNPWRFSFDPIGRLWVGDVGERSREEINWVRMGGNYGWDVAEGSECHEPSECSLNGLQMPVFEYGNVSGAAITGGSVYSGTSCVSELGGKYVYADFVQGDVWALPFDNLKVFSPELVASTGKNISTFGVDPDGELLVGVYGEPGEILHFSCAGLGVELSSFDAVADGRSVLITWQTTSEENNAGFEIHQRNPLREWRVIDFVPGRGTTSDVTDYSYLVSALEPGRYAFRLTQIDTDGSRTQGPLVEVDILLPDRPFTASAFPNPARLQVNLNLFSDHARRYEITVFDLLGRRIRSVPSSREKPGLTRITLNREELPAGVYVVQVESGGSSEAVPIVFVD